MFLCFLTWRCTNYSRLFWFYKSTARIFNCFHYNMQLFLPSCFSRVEASCCSSHFPVTKQSLIEFNIWKRQQKVFLKFLLLSTSGIESLNYVTSSKSQLWEVSGVKQEQSGMFAWTFLLFWGRLTRNSPPSSSSSSESSASTTAKKNKCCYRAPTNLIHQVLSQDASVKDLQDLQIQEILKKYHQTP